MFFRSIALVFPAPRRGGEHKNISPGGAGGYGAYFFLPVRTAMPVRDSSAAAP